MTAKREVNGLGSSAADRFQAAERQRQLEEPVMLCIRARFIVAAIALPLVFTAGSAEAAKGVKKVAPADAQHTLTGEVLSVTPKNGTVNFQVRTATHHKKQGATQTQTHVHDLVANKTTRLVDHNGLPAYPVSVHHGVRVRVQAKGNQATNVQILTHKHVPVHFARYRTHAYRLHLYYSHLRLHPHHHHYHHR